SIVTSSRSEHVSAYSDAENPPTETQSGTPSSRSLGSASARKRSRPGFASPIEFNIPPSVSAIRTGALPPRGSGVTVFVTKASSERATSGAASASRQPEAFRSTSATLLLRRDGEARDARRCPAGGDDGDPPAPRGDRHRGCDLARRVHGVGRRGEAVELHCADVGEARAGDRHARPD